MGRTVGNPALIHQADVSTSSISYARRDACLRSRDEMVLTSSIDTAIGPTPTVTGGMYDAFAATPSESTSPTSLPFGRRLMPTSITTAPVRTICGRMRLGLPAAT